MPLGTFVAGRYSSTIDPPGATGATDLGLMEKGYEIEVQHEEDNIVDTDAYARMVIDQVFQGINAWLQGTAKEWKAGPLLAAFPQAVLAPTGATFLGPGVIARLASALAGVLIMTATTGTPAAAAPATLTATFAKIAENFPIRWMLGSEHRRLPFRFRMLPYDDSGTIKIFTAT